MNDRSAERKAVSNAAESASRLRVWFANTRSLSAEEAHDVAGLLSAMSGWIEMADLLMDRNDEASRRSSEQ